MEFLYEDEGYKIIGACFEVYNDKGSGFLEAVYQECLELEFKGQRVPFVSQQELTLNYKGIPLKKNLHTRLYCI